MPKVRLDKLMVERGLATSRERARNLVESGGVKVQGMPASKGAMQVDSGAHVELIKEDHPFVSRGAFKLEAALDHYQIDPKGFHCIDVGASTGGFTDLLLRRGAKKVFAIDVGYGQLAWSLRQDERVVVLERENIRHLDVTKITTPCDLAVVDVSFISLTLVLPKIAEILGPPGIKTIIALVKPQFEIGKGRVGKGGVVRDVADRLECVQKIRDWAAANGFQSSDAIESPIQGPAGNVEYLLMMESPRYA